MKFDAAIFDMDGTLIDSLIFWNILWEKMGQTYLHTPGFRPSQADDKAVRTMLMKDAMALIHKNYGIADSAEALLAFTNRLIEEFYATIVEVKPGVREFLEHCKEEGVKMCIASATERDLVLLALKHCGLDGYFEKVFSCGDIGKGKDQPDIYLIAREYLGTQIKDTWVFEDSLVAIETAAKLGMPTVAIYDPDNFGQERMQKIASHYIAKDQTLMELV